MRPTPIGTAALWVALLLSVACSRTRPDVPSSAAEGAENEAPASDAATNPTSVPVAAAPPPKAPLAAARARDPQPADAGTCPQQADPTVGVLVSPRRPAVGEPVRVVAATLANEAGLALRLESTDGSEVPQPTLRHRPGVPAAVIAQWTPGAAGVVRAVVGRDGEGVACVDVRIRSARKAEPPDRDEGTVWPVRNAWDGAEEALYSAWVRELFAAPRGEELAFKALHALTADPERNVLHDHFGWGEDARQADDGLFLRPDCADLPYFLRAYFAWKRRLPHGFRKCSRGSPGRAPRCGALLAIPGSTVDVPEGSTKEGELATVQRYFRRDLAWGVHTGNGRTALGDDDTDLYPVALSRAALRPGTVYADPYGHILVVAEMMAAQGRRPGVLYAVDGQPDGSITRKRFWEGNFLWNADPALGGSGFKAFRPLVVADDGVRPLGNAEIARRSDYGDMSQEQADLEPEEFYDRMEALITPGVRDPYVAQQQAVVALAEAATVRVTSVNNGQEFLQQNPGNVVEMPDGHSIFETTGSWENYSTPARDLRMLIAMDVVARFDHKVARDPSAYGIEPGPALNQLRKDLGAARAKLLNDRQYGFEYRRSDGRSQFLTLADLLERADALEMAYNPNDCPEVRWGAPQGSKELATCNRRAPAEQQRKMAAYRVWFKERRRPARGDAGPPVR